MSLVPTLSPKHSCLDWLILNMLRTLTLDNNLVKSSDTKPISKFWISPVIYWILYRKWKKIKWLFFIVNLRSKIKIWRASLSAYCFGIILKLKIHKMRTICSYLMVCFWGWNYRRCLGLSERCVWVCSHAGNLFQLVFILPQIGDLIWFVPMKNPGMVVFELTLG